MSLVSMILLNEPFKPPKGKSRTHRIDGSVVKYTPKTIGKAHRSTEINKHNLVKIRAALKLGIRTYNDIADVTGLSYSGVKTIMLDMRANAEIYSEPAAYKQPLRFFFAKDIKK